MAPEHEHATMVDEEDDVQLGEDDVVEIVEDDGPGGDPMDDDDDEFGGYDGEIVIGGPGPGEEDMEDMEEVDQIEDNSWGASSVHKPQQSVFKIALHPAFPNPPLAVSGGEDDMAYIFCPLPAVGENPSVISSETFAPVPLSGHTDSVVDVKWSHDGDMVATAGMDGKVRVYKYNQTDGWPFVTELDAGSEIQWIEWHPKGPVLAAGCEDSSVWLWQLPSGNVMTVLSGHTMPLTAGVFPPPAGRQILTASLDSSLILWNPSAGTPMFKTNVFVGANAMEMDPAEHGITALAVSPNGALAAVGSSAGKVKIVSLPKGDIVTSLEGHTEGESIEALQFVDLLGGAGGGKGVVLVSGGTDGKGFVWDLHTRRVRAELHHDEPITSLAAHPAPAVHLVTSGSADRTLKTWDVRTGALVAEHKGHMGVVNGVAVAPAPAGGELSAAGLAQPQVVVSAGDEGVSLVWRV